MKKYSVKFLFQYRIDSNLDEKMRTCEEKTLIFTIENSEDIISLAIKKAKELEFEYLNDCNNKVFFEFIGILDICHLGIEVEENEVWYDIKTMLTPMERKDKILPSIEQLKKHL